MQFLIDRIQTLLFLRGNEDNSSPERPNKCSTMRHELEGNVEHYTKWGDSLWDRPVWKLRHQQNLRSVGEEIARPVLSLPAVMSGKPPSSPSSFCCSPFPDKPVSVVPLLSRALHRIRSTPPRIIASPPTRTSFTCRNLLFLTLCRATSCCSRHCHSYRSCTKLQCPDNFHRALPSYPSSSS